MSQALAFGPDGLLYCGEGDGTVCAVWPVRPSLLLLLKFCIRGPVVYANLTSPLTPHA